MDIIFHIGLGKCASTTLQNQVFSNDKGYLGTQQTLEFRKNYAKRFKSFSPVGARQWGSLQQAKRWAREVVDTVNPDLNRLILSEESLTNRNKLSNRPIIKFLKKFSQEIWTIGDLKVVIILRNPADRLASSYAENSISNPNASQEDFERYIIKKLATHQQIAYDLWVKELYQNFGKDKVCVLLMEDIAELTFWSQLKEFCQLENFQPEAALNNTGLNTRRATKNNWAIRPFDPAYKAKTMALNTFGLIWAPYRLPSLRPQAFNKFQSNLQQYYQHKYPAVNFSRESVIELKSNLREDIKSKYKSKTNRLSDLLNRDLSKINY